MCFDQTCSVLLTSRRGPNARRLEPPVDTYSMLRSLGRCHNVPPSHEEDKLFHSLATEESFVSSQKSGNAASLGIQDGNEHHEIFRHT
jgi:hypothetical protein